MVALRTPPAGPPRTPSEALRDVGPALFEAWRRLLTSLSRGVSRALGASGRSKPARAVVLAARYVRDPAGTLAGADAGERALLNVAGAVALAAGVAVSFALPASLGPSLVGRFLAAGWLAAWALARLLVMRTVARGALATRPSAVTDAWGPSLLPFAFAVIAPLPLVALGVSAFLTLRGLAGLGADRGEARRVVAIAFGGQLAAEVLAWLGRGGLLYLLIAMRG